MPASASHVLVVVEDRHAEPELRRVLDRLRPMRSPVTILTADALLAMRLTREHIDARLTVDRLTPDTVVERDRVALDGVEHALEGSDQTRRGGLWACLHYTLIPMFVRAVRNVTAVDDQLTAQPVDRVVLVGGGPLVDAARLVARRRGLASDTAGGDWHQRVAQAWARLRAGRATRWVNTEYRALVLEPGFILLTLLRGWGRRIVGRSAPVLAPHAILVAADRFSADVVERLRNESRRPTYRQ